MDIQSHTHPDKLERYSFLWSEARLGIAALALFLGGVPPLIKFLPVAALLPLILIVLKIAWVISGAASVYLLYRWNQSGKKLFGATNQKDTAAFFVMIVSGFNLGFTGLFGRNIGMTIVSDQTVFIIVGILYLLSATHLWRGWKAAGEKIF